MTVIPHFAPVGKTVGIFVYAAFQLLDASGPIAVFEVANRERPGAYRVRVVSMTGGRITSSSGVSFDSVAAKGAGPFDTLMVVGGDGSLEAMQQLASIDYLRELQANVRRLCSVCSGAFLLASAGLLDGRRATTHWRRANHLRTQFPAVRVEVDRIYIRDGSIWTSAGVSAGIDLSLALIAEDLGEAVARHVAQDLVVYYRRPGGQSQFSALAELDGGATVFSPLFVWMRAHLADSLSVDQLAQKMAMSPRNFSRRFADAVGLSPAKAVARLRLESAREKVESSREPIESVAASTGYQDPERMRRAFVRAYGHPPQVIRRINV